MGLFVLVALHQAYGLIETVISALFVFRPFSLIDTICSVHILLNIISLMAS